MADEVLSIIATSLKIAGLSSALVMISAFFLANYFVQKNTPWARAGELLVYLPMALPPVAVGYLLLTAFGRRTYLGQILQSHVGIDLAFSAQGAVLAAFVVSLGIGVRAFRIALENVDQDLIDMAKACGARTWQILFYIKLPHCRRALLGGTLLVFIRSLGEFGATMVFAGNTLGQTRTLALAIWTDMQAPGRAEHVFFLMLITILISALALFASEALLRPRRKYM